MLLKQQKWLALRTDSRKLATQVIMPYNSNMNQRIDAIFENGVFRPVVPVNLASGEHVSLNIESQTALSGGFENIKDLLDVEFIASCRQGANEVPSLEEVHNLLSNVDGSLANRIVHEREER